MNKVSWTTRDELRRATIVVIVTVFLISLYLFGVDFVWSTFLQRIGILRFASENLGSQAG
jgi:preprotein translocase subunit SecE